MMLCRLCVCTDHELREETSHVKVDKTVGARRSLSGLVSSKRSEHETLGFPVHIPAPGSLLVKRSFARRLASLFQLRLAGRYKGGQADI